MRINPSQRKQRAGIALFILLTSLVIISLAMKSLIQSSSLQADRTRNYYDRVQAIYLARSTLNLARFFLLFDSFMDNQAGEEQSDSLQDLWVAPVPFPVPQELLQAFQEEAGVDKEMSEMAEEKQKACGEFFDDFQGNATSQTIDLNRRLDLNELGSQANKAVYETLIALLSPNIDFINQLDLRGIDPEELARQIRDYMDRNNVEDQSNASEDSPYIAEELEYVPKNRPFQIDDELKLIPQMDAELFDYLSPFVSTVYIANRGQGAKINLNTVEKEVFQALLKDVSNPGEIAENFIRDREENGRVYTPKNFKEILRDEFSLDAETIQMGLLGTSSDAFLVKTESNVNQVTIQVEAIVLKPTKKKQKKPVIQMRISP